MQDRYVCDIGDFGKYGLLRALVRDDLRLGVVWYLNPAVETNSDGSFVGYLEEGNERGFRECDPELYDALRRLWRAGKRRIHFIEQSGILAPPTLFYGAPLTFESLPRAERKERRTEWHRGALRATEKAQIVFFDPDNGMTGKSARPHSKNAPKYVFPEELIPYAERGQSLVVYQHQNRSRALHDQIELGLKRLTELVGHSRVWALSFHRKSVRIFFVLASEDLERILRQRISEFVMGLWNSHFRLHE